jgi:hypothetical protein
MIIRYLAYLSIRHSSCYGLSLGSDLLALLTSLNSELGDLIVIVRGWSVHPGNSKLGWSIHMAHDAPGSEPSQPMTRGSGGSVPELSMGFLAISHPK